MHKNVRNEYQRYSFGARQKSVRLLVSTAEDVSGCVGTLLCAGFIAEITQQAGMNCRGYFQALFQSNWQTRQPWRERGGCKIEIVSLRNFES